MNLFTVCSELISGPFELSPGPLESSLGPFESSRNKRVMKNRFHCIINIPPYNEIGPFIINFIKQLYS